MQEQKTGQFHLYVEVGLEASEAEKDHRRSRGLFEMAGRVVAFLHNDRRYELVAEVGVWEPGGGLGERLRVDFTLVLLDPLTAEVGEWVKNLPQRVPEREGRCQLGEGYGQASGRVFERAGRLGWQRIE